MTTRMRQLNERGASAVEFALLLPLLMLILFGIIEFGLALYQQAVLTNASREGARSGIVQCTANCPSMSAAVSTYLTNAGINPAQVTQNYACPVGVAIPGGVPVCVTLTLPYTYTVLSGLASLAPVTLRASSVMRHE